MSRFSAGGFEGCKSERRKPGGPRNRDGGGVSKSVWREYERGGREREREIGEEAVRARARKTEAVPSQREVEEHNLDH